jgi:succinate-semialdehyde dehydrogenase / glutarate-semialdehyde dehydrogenase
MEAVTMGDPFDKATKLGPIARKDLRDDLHAQVEKSIAAGATLVCGGTVPEGDGFFYPATLLENVTPGMPAYDEELFGPVASLIRAASFTTRQ